MTRIDPIPIDTGLVRRLVAGQFPHWADLPVTPVAQDGWDNRSFHLGTDMKVRLPSAAAYVAQVAKEWRWLPRLAPHLSLAIPVPLAVGEPAHGYPWPWSIHEWLEGDTASTARITELTPFAIGVAEFLVALQRIDATGGPPAGEHNFFRGGPPAVYDAEAREAIGALDGRIDTGTATATWDAAVEATWNGRPVWVHGDIAVGNLLVQDGRLSAVIDFGSSGVGDPACDLVIAWTFLEGESRNAFRRAVPADEAMWARARGWALWKALITLAHDRPTDPAEATASDVVDRVLADHRSSR